MKIFDMQTNHMDNPLGVDWSKVKLSFRATEGHRFSLSVIEETTGAQVYTAPVDLADTGNVYIEGLLKPGLRYKWQVSVDNYESDDAVFETASVLDAPFITPQASHSVPTFFTDFEAGKVKSARLYITGLGLYHAKINGERVGDKYLAPYFNDYNDYLRYQTYDITEMLEDDNRIEVVVGDGWYMGRFGIDGHGGNTYGSQYLLSAKIVIEEEDGSIKVIGTDKSWQCHTSYVTKTAIYDGETRDDMVTLSEPGCVKTVKTDYRLEPDFSEPIVEKLVLKPTLYTSPSGQTILDFGQNMVGVCRFVNRLGAGKSLKLSFGEILQDDEFYNDNYRSADAIYHYTSDGQVKEVEPYFTFYGFRYVLVEGLETVDPEDFGGVVLSSGLRETLEVSTSHFQLNQLMKNTLWGQRGNFMDVPTDCPQRDERLGWTADAQVFVSTACYQMDSFNFYEKFIRDMRYDQRTFYDGDIPMYCPSLKKSSGNGGAVWADAATIIPWELYQAYGDVHQLEHDYPMMYDYVETLIRKDEAINNTHIMTEGFTFGDWLAQDGVCDQSMKGGTDDNYIKTMYYYRSLQLISKAARVIGKEKDAKRYLQKAEQVKTSILHEFFTRSGRLSIDTQTAYILSLAFEIYESKARVIEGFKDRLKKDFFKIKSGFTGTPLFLKTLFENGMDEEAYRILFNEDLPGWFYAINMGATTIWERWNSLNPDGKISGTMMNSFNHYAFGAVCEAVYAYIAGLKCETPGWKKALIAPKLSHQLKDMKIAYQSPVGEYKVEWSITGGKNFKMSVTIPYGAEATVVLPEYNGNSTYVLQEGTYNYAYELARDMIHPFGPGSYVMDVLNNEEAVKIFRELCPQASAIVSGENKEFTIMRVAELAYLDMFGVSHEQMGKLIKRLAKVEV